MTTNETKLARMGKDFWMQYVRINGYAFSPSQIGLERLSRNLDVAVAYLRKCIYLYLSA